MASTVFEALWADAFASEGELLSSAVGLAQALAISSAMEAIKLARVFEEAGRPFYDHCEAAFEEAQRRKLNRVGQRLHLSSYQLAFLKVMIDKAAGGHW
jgi:hypothetical protein